MIDLKTPDESNKKSRFEELDNKGRWDYLNEERFNEGHSILNDEKTYLYLRLLTDISDTLALILDEMRGVKHE